MNEDINVKVLGQMDNTLDHTFESANRVYDTNGLCPTIPASTGSDTRPKIVAEDHKARYRIRKLTPRECGRLMVVRDSDIDKMAAVNSNSQLYKQFGNSIVVDVMCAMFRKLNIKGVVNK